MSLLFVALWLGDGVTGRTEIASSEEATREYLVRYAAVLSRIHGVELHVHSIRTSVAGTAVGDTGYTTNADAWKHSISVRSGSGDANPVLDGLEALGILHPKRDGIPLRIRQASRIARLKCLAGLMDSDGSLDITSNNLRFSQFNAEHENIVLHAREMAYDVGISVSAVREYTWQHKMKEGEDLTGYFIELAAGSELLSPYMQLRRKCVDEFFRRFNPDIKKMDISEGGWHTICPIEVQGGVLTDRLLVSS